MSPNQKYQEVSYETHQVSVCGGCLRNGRDNVRHVCVRRDVRQHESQRDGCPSYTLTVPESITLTSTKTGTGTYTGTIPVNVKGDIGEGQTVTVTSTAPTMKCAGAKNVTATFTGTPKKTWSRTEAASNGTTENYALSATLTPGTWEGTATFSCTLA